MSTTLREQIRELAQKYRTAPDRARLNLTRQAVRAMRDAGLTDEDAMKLWFHLHIEVAQERRARA